MLLRIPDWREKYENNRTRDLKHLNWIPIPAKLDGDGYTELVDCPDGAAIYGCWVACVIIAGRCDPRGTLVRDKNVPHDSKSLSRICRLSESDIQKMIERALTVGWLEICDDPAPSCGSGGMKVPLNKQTRKETNEETNEHLNVAAQHSKARARSNKSKLNELDERWETFWRNYPRRNGRLVGKQATLKRWASLEDGEINQVLVAESNYAKSLAGSDIKPRDPERFLKDGWWKDWLEVPEGVKVEMEIPF